MKSIAIFQTDLGLGGLQKSLLNLLNNIDYKKYNVDLYLFNKKNFYLCVPNKVNVIFLKNSFINRLLPFNKLLKKNFLFNKEYDIAIDFNGYNANTALCALKTNAKKRFIWVHNDLYVKYQNEYKYRILYKLGKEKYNYFDKIICVSEGARQSFEKLSNIKDKYIVIPNYINTKEIIEKAKAKRDFKIDDTRYNFVCLGRLCYQKGYDTLFPIIKKLLNERRDFHLYIIGDGKIKNKLIKQVKSLGIKPYVSFFGARNNPFSLLNQMDCLLFNSRYEGQGMVLLEAKALGLEIIMPKHLEKYCDGIKGVDNPLEAMVNAHKKDKVFDDLKDYNDNIRDLLYNLFEEK